MHAQLTLASSPINVPGKFSSEWGFLVQQLNFHPAFSNFLPGQEESGERMLQNKRSEAFTLAFSSGEVIQNLVSYMYFLAFYQSIQEDFRCRTAQAQADVWPSGKKSANIQSAYSVCEAGSIFTGT